MLMKGRTPVEETPPAIISKGKKNNYNIVNPLEELTG